MASKSSDEDWDYFTSHLNDQDDESVAINGTFRNIQSKNQGLFYCLVSGYINLSNGSINLLQVHRMKINQMSIQRTHSALTPDQDGLCGFILFQDQCKG